MYRLGTMEEKENSRYDTWEDRNVRTCMDLGTKVLNMMRTAGMIVER
jgi:hypothetical protein